MASRISAMASSARRSTACKILYSASLLDIAFPTRDVVMTSLRLDQWNSCQRFGARTGSIWHLLREVTRGQVTLRNFTQQRLFGSTNALRIAAAWMERTAGRNPHWARDVSLQ